MPQYSGVLLIMSIISLADIGSNNIIMSSRNIEQNNNSYKTANHKISIIKKDTLAVILSKNKKTK